MGSASVVLDTNVLVYAIGGEHPLRDPARAVITEVTVGRIRATTTPQVIQEFAYVVARRRDRATAAEAAKNYARLLHPLLISDSDDLERGLRWWTEMPTLGSFDAVLMATVDRLAPNRPLVTADQAVIDSGLIPTVALSDPTMFAMLNIP